MRPLVGALAAIVALGFAGCGGGRTTHDAFVEDAATICRRANERFGAIDVVIDDSKLIRIRAAVTLNRESFSTPDELCA